MASNKYKPGHDVRDLHTIKDEKFSVPRSKLLKLAPYDWFTHDGEIKTLVQVQGCKHVWILSLKTMEQLDDRFEVNLKEHFVKVEYDDVLRAEAVKNDSDSVIRCELVMAIYRLYKVKS